MNKLFFSLILLVPISSSAMNNPGRFLIAGTTTIASGAAGTYLANRIYESGYENFSDVDHYSPIEEKYQSGCKKYQTKAAISGATQMGYLAASALLGRYMYYGGLPANNMQTYASLLAIAAGGGICAWSNARKIIKTHEIWPKKQSSYKYTTMWMSGLSLAALGSYGLYRNS